MLQNFLLSLARTWAPIAVGTAATYLAEHGHVVLSADTQQGVVTLAVGLVAAGYYLLVRLVETRFPKAGWLLGHPAKPDYGLIEQEAGEVGKHLASSVALGDFTSPDPLETPAASAGVQQ